MYNNCCEDLQTKCTLNNINQRTLPLEYISGPGPTGTLIVNAILESTNDILPSANTICNIGATGLWFDKLYAAEIYSANSSVYVGEAKITSNGTQLQLPANTTIGGSPPASPILIYSYPVTTANQSYPSSGTYLHTGLSTADWSIFPIFISKNGTITSFAAYFFTGSGVGLSATNISIELRIYNLDKTITNTGQFITSSGGSLVFNSPYIYSNNNINVSVTAGQRIGAYLTYTGSMASTTQPIPTISVGFLAS